MESAGLRLETLNISGFTTGLDVHSLMTMGRAAYQLPLATVAARRLLNDFKADVVLGTAGYVCVPVVTAASMSRIPVVLLEQNARPGRAIRLLSRRAEVVATSFAETAAHLPWAKVMHTGNPIRAEIASRCPGARRDRCRQLLVMGGSQGARRLNQAITGCIPELLREHPGLQVTHQCGSLDSPWVAEAARGLPRELRDRYRVEPFFDDVGTLLSDADLVLMRAGGSSLAECSAMGRPMILVPYPHVGGHQEDNAMPYVRRGAAVHLPDAECTPQRVRSEISTLIRDVDRWRAMAEASVSMGRPDAAERVVDVVRQVAGRAAAVA